MDQQVGGAVGLQRVKILNGYVTLQGASCNQYVYHLTTLWIALGGLPCNLAAALSKK
jgi:hypothetical protein